MVRITKELAGLIVSMAKEPYSHARLKSVAKDFNDVRDVARILGLDKELEKTTIDELRSVRRNIILNLNNVISVIEAQVQQ